VTRGLRLCVEDVPQTPPPRRCVARPGTPSVSSQAPQQQALKFQAPSPRTPAGPTPRRRANGAARGPLVLLGAGAGGVEELRRALEGAGVCWALHRFQVGSGTFVRTKLVAIHVNAEHVPALQRARLNARGPEVLAALGKAHATLEVAKAEELTAEHLCRRLLPLFASDNLGDYSLLALQRDYERAVLRAGQVARRPQQAPELGSRASAEHALREVGLEAGQFNWALLDPARFELHGSGCGGLEEMRDHLAEDRVLFGILRLSFGCGQRSGARTPAPHVTKHVLVHWMGPSVGAVQRGRWNARAQEAAALVARYCAVALRREVRRASDLRLEELLKDLRRLTAVDVAAARISAAEYLSALREEAREREARARRQAVPQPCEQAPGPAGIGLEDALAAVKEPSGDCDWLLCGWRPALASPRSPALGGC